MLKVTSREYKLTFRPKCFKKRREAVALVWRDAAKMAKSLGLKGRGEFKTLAERSIAFLDTKQESLRENGLILRQRTESNGDAQYTLKLRDPDRYIANAIDVLQAEGLSGKEKFEEDIASPFLSRFSHSNTVTFKLKSNCGAPSNLAEAVEIFPALRRLRCRGVRCRLPSKLHAVNDLVVQEQVFSGPDFVLGGKVKSGVAEVGLIIWSTKAHGQPAIVEFSFRYRARNEKFQPAVAIAAKAVFDALQHSDWAESESSTKTAFIFDGGTG
jgi:hypothetical protein